MIGYECVSHNISDVRGLVGGEQGRSFRLKQPGWGNDMHPYHCTVKNGWYCHPTIGTTNKDEAFLNSTLSVQGMKCSVCWGIDGVLVWCTGTSKGLVECVSLLTQGILL